MNFSSRFKKVFDYLMSQIFSLWLARRRRGKGAFLPMAILTPDTIGDAIVVKGRYELQELQALFGWLQAECPCCLDGIALDVGANVGNHTLFFSRYFPRVISFEPNPRLFKLLEYNTSDLKDVEIRNVGLSDQSVRLFLSVPRNNSGGGTVTESPGKLPIILEKLDCQGLENKKVTLIKIDIEGHELKALKGGRGLIECHKPIIIIEQNESEFSDGKSQSLDWLKQLGYTEFYTVEKVGLPILRKLTRMRVERKTRFKTKSYPMIIALPRKPKK